MINRICVSAYNIHSGGGKVVLLAFLKEKSTEGNIITCYIDERLNIDFEKHKEITFVKIKPTFLSRINCEKQYKSISKNFDSFYFIGNLPPVAKLNCNVVLFLQNRLIISKPYINTLSLKTILRSFLEIFWFKMFLKNTDLVEVQTQSMKNEMNIHYPLQKVEIHNYIDFDELLMMKSQFEKAQYIKEKNSFVYIASPDPHKNHKRLIMAFARIKEALGEYSLYLNIDEKSKYYSLAKELNVNLKCIIIKDREELLKQIYCSEYLIFPSLIESLGLPLIEAKMMGTKIIASDLDFVFDVCEPVGKFNPVSIVSISHEIVRLCE